MNSKSATLNVRVTKEMREAIRAAATKDGESEGVLVRKVKPNNQAELPPPDRDGGQRKAHSNET